MRARVTRTRLGFRILLGVALVWSAWPTVASALDRPADARPTASARQTSPPTTSASSSVTTSTTVVVPPPSTDVPAPATDPPTTIAPAPAAVEPRPPPTEPPAADPAAAPAPPALPDLSAFAVPWYCDAGTTDVLAAMNEDRQANGVPALCGNAQLDGIAQRWADQLAQTRTFVHQDLWSVVGTTPFRAMGENLLRGPGAITTDQMESAWMASTGHREHILDPTYVVAGVGRARGGDGALYVVVEFGGLLR